MELGLSALSPTVGLSGLPDPMGDATAALEARRRQQVQGARAPAWMRDIGANLGNLADQPLSAFIPPELRDRLPSAEMVGNLVLGALPGSGDYMAARDALESSAASMSALGRGDYMGAGARGIDALAAGLGIMPFLPYLASIKGVKNPIRAYHGSPHDFDKFSMDKIGSGEGGQAFGHGLYFAENEGVARSYRDTLSDILVGGKKLDYSTPLSAAEDAAVWAHMEGSRDAAIRRIESTTHHLQNSRHKDIPEFRALEYLRSGAPLPDVKPTGRMYEVNIHADPSRFLDWDAPLSAQSDKARAALADMKPEWTGGQIYESSRLVPGDFMDKRAAASALQERGIPGIKYLDAGSRSAGDGTRNYVVFDDKLIEILRKYGIMAPVAGAGIGSLYLDGEEGGM